MALFCPRVHVRRNYLNKEGQLRSREVDQALHGPALTAESGPALSWVVMPSRRPAGRPPSHQSPQSRRTRSSMPSFVEIHSLCPVLENLGSHILQKTALCL